MNATSAAGDSGTGGGGSEAVAPAWIQDATLGLGAAGAAAAVGGAAQIHGTSTTVNGTIVVHHTLGSAFHAAPNAVADRTNVSHEHRGGMAHHNLQQRLHPSDRHTLGSAFHAAPNAVADGTNVSHEHRGGKAHQNLQPSSTASSKTAGDNGEPYSKASSKPPRVVKGFNGVPFIPHDLVPLRDVDNTVKHAEKIHECSFVFDPTRKEIWDNNSPPCPEVYNRTVTHIAMVIKRAKTLGREIIMNNVFENFTAIGLTVADGVPVDSKDRVIQFINSQGVMELFKNHHSSSWVFFSGSFARARLLKRILTPGSRKNFGMRCGPTDRLL